MVRCGEGELPVLISAEAADAKAAASLAACLAATLTELSSCAWWHTRSETGPCEAILNGKGMGRDGVEVGWGKDGAGWVGLGWAGLHWDMMGWDWDGRDRV